MRILIKDLVPDTDYIIQARGRNAEGTSPWSGILEIHTLKDTTPPSPVENLEFVPSGTSFVATWERPTTSADGTLLEDFAYYTVHITGNSITRMYRVTQERFDLTFEMNVGAFEGVAASVSISVVAVDHTGNESEAVIVVAENPPPGPITGLVGAEAADAIDIRWDATTELDWKHYQVLVGTSPSEGAAVHRAYPESNDYSVFSVAYNTDHYIFVRQIDLFGTPGPASMVGPFRPKNYWLVDTTAPSGVTINSITSAVDPTDPSGGRSQITLAWTGSTAPDLSGYTIRYSTSNAGPWEYIEAPREATSAVIRRLFPATAYYVGIQAYDYQGNKSAWINAGSTAPNYPHTTVGDTTPPSQVTGVAINGGGSNVTITWNAVTDADVINNQGYYQIQIDQQNTFNTANLKSMTNSGTVVSFTSLPANTTYYARVRAYDRSGNAGPWSSIVSGGTGTAATPLSDGIAPASSPTPTVISLLGALGVQWTPVGNVDIVTYEVHLSVTSGFTPAAGTKAGEVTGTSFQIRTLPGTTTLLSYGTTYYVKLIAKDRDGSAAAGSQGSGQISKVATQDFSGTARDLGAIQVFRQDTAPAGTNYIVNDLWFKTPENISHVWTGSAWLENQDAGIDYAAAQAAIAITNASTAQTTANNAVSAAAAAQADADAALVNAQTAQTTADGKAVTYFQTTAPTGLVAADVGDLWFDTDDGNKMYRWSGSAWVVSQDTAITTAINNAAAAATAAGNAQTTANSKIVTYYQAAAPTGGTYTTGDLWVDSDGGNRIYRWSGSAWTSLLLGTDAINFTARSIGATTTYRQTTAPATGMLAGDFWLDSDDGDKLYRYSGTVWEEVSDDRIVTAITAAATAQSTADGKARIYVQTAAPTGLTASDVDDLWIDSDDNNHPYRWSGTAWTSVRDATIAAAQAAANTAIANAATAQAAADGKVVTHFQTTAPTGKVAGDVGDLWFDTDDSNKMYYWSGTAWDLAADQRIAQAVSAAANAQTTANSKITTYYAASAPTGGTYTAGDLWVRSSDNRLHRWSGSAWVEVVDTSIATAQAAATAAAAVADGKVTTFFQTSVPTSISIGDLWIDTDDGNKPYRANAKNVSTIVTSGNGWYAIQDAGITTALTGLAGKITTYYQATMPSETGPVTGDLWIDTDDGNRIYRFNAALGAGSKWVSTQFGGGAIQDASIGGVKLVASSVTAEKLTIGTFSPNAIPNYSFEDLQQITVPGTPAGLPARWFYDTVIPAAGATYNVHTALVRSGARSIAMANAASSQARILNADYLSAAAGETWYVAAAVAGPTVTTGNSVSLQVHFSDQIGTNTSFTVVTETDITATNTWKRVEGQFTVPANATQLKVAVVLKTSATSRTIYLDMVEAFPVTTGTMIKDDSIATGHIVTAGLNASVVKFGEMDGDRIGVNTLNANRMEAGTAFTTDLFVKSVFTLGDAALGAGQIKSFDYSSGLGTGFKLTSSGLDIQAGTINARALQIQQGHNMVPAQYAGFEFNPSFYTSSTIAATNATFAASTTRKRFETSSLYMTNTSAVTQGSVTFSSSESTYNISVNTDTAYVASAYVYHENPSTTYARVVVRRTGGSYSTGIGIEIPYGTWTRISVPFTTTGTTTGVNIRVDALTPSTSLWIDGVQLEPILGGLSTPSEWKPPGVTSIDGGIIRTGSIRSTALTTEGDTTTPMWSIDTQGTAIFGDAMVKGRLVVGQTGNANNSTISVRSYNYSPGTAGWSIAGNGSVEFNTGMFRGALAVGSKFTVLTDGTMTAVDGSFSGAITAKSGNISGILQVGDGASGEKYLIVGSSNAGNPHFVLDGRTTRSHMAYAYNGSGVTFSVDNNGNSFFGGQITVGATVASGSPIATTTYVNNQDSAVQSSAYSSASSMVVSERSASTTITNKTIASSTLIAGAYAGAVPRVEIAATGDHREIRFYADQALAPGYIDHAYSVAFGSGQRSGMLKFRTAQYSNGGYGEMTLNAWGLSVPALNTSGTVSASTVSATTVTASYPGGVYDSGYRVYSPDNPPPNSHSHYTNDHGHGNNWWGGTLRMTGGITSDDAFYTGSNFMRPNSQTSISIGGSGGNERYLSVLNVSNGATKTFVIEHPEEKNKYLVHAAIEGPTADVFYRGAGKLKVDGRLLEDGAARVARAIIELPGYFESLTEKDGRTVTITPIVEECDCGGFLAPSMGASRVVNGKFTVYALAGFTHDCASFYWEVKAVRKSTKFEVEPSRSSVALHGDGPYTYLTPKA